MSAPTPSTGGGGLWGPLERHPRRAFLSLAGIAIVLVLASGLAGGALGARLQSARDQQLPGGHLRVRRAPVQFGGNLDPYGHRHGGPIRMSFVGASVTRGWYVTSVRNAYPAVAARIIAGEHGRPVDWKVTALPGAPAARALTWAYPADQDLIVVDIVTNDFLYDTPAASYEAQYTALLQKLRRSSPRAGFVCLGDWGPIGAVDQAGETAYSFDQVVAATCNAFDGVYVPINQIYDVPGARGPLGHPSIVGPARNLFHPNDYGDELIAEAVVSGINGDPPTEAVPSGPGILQPKPRALLAPGAPPGPINGHETPTPKPNPGATPDPQPTP
ncbi:MAG: hypothetical protein J2P44_10545 [Candidatus Dormibacteraeota bacterium]|nr:hypothetical protein [Candidatus Dormibacteraeota bacterium]